MERYLEEYKALCDRFVKTCTDEPPMPFLDEVMGIFATYAPDEGFPKFQRVLEEVFARVEEDCIDKLKDGLEPNLDPTQAYELMMEVLFDAFTEWAYLDETTMDLYQSCLNEHLRKYEASVRIAREHILSVI